MSRKLWFLVVATAACGETPPASGPCLDLIEVARYGHAELTDSSRSDLAAAGVLGDIRAAVVAPNDEILVLDRYSHQIVGFRRDGSVTRVIRGGEGEGPGEFVLPMHLTATRNGVAVVDYELRRGTEFSWSGELLRVWQLNTPSPWRQLVRHDSAWVTYSGSGSHDGPVFHVVDIATGMTTRGPPLNEEDQPFGQAVGSVFAPGGEFLIPTARPGVWMEYTGDRGVRRGRPLFPNMAPPITEPISPNLSQVSPAQHTASGLVLVGDSIVLQGIRSWLRPFDWNDPPARDEQTISLAAFFRDGMHIETFLLPTSAKTTYMSADPSTGRVFIPVTDPYPQLIEYELNACEQDRGGGRGDVDERT